MNTLGSLAKRGWVDNPHGVIRLTDAGYEAMHQYTRAKPNLRKIGGELTERVRGLLHVHKIITMRKAG